MLPPLEEAGCLSAEALAGTACSVSRHFSRVALGLSRLSTSRRLPVAPFEFVKVWRQLAEPLPGIANRAREGQEAMREGRARQAYTHVSHLGLHTRSGLQQLAPAPCPEGWPGAQEKAALASVKAHENKLGEHTYGSIWSTPRM